MFQISTLCITTSPQRANDSQLKSQRLLASLLFRISTSCHQKRARYNYLHVATVAIVLVIAVYVIVLIFTIYVFANNVCFTPIRLSVAIIYGARVAV